MTLRERLIKYHEEKEVKYKQIALDCEIPFSSMYNFTSGLRDLRAGPAARLEEYLKNKGY